MEEIKPAYGIGDKVRIVNYGHLVWVSKNESKPNKSIIMSDADRWWVDMAPELVGQTGLVQKVIETQNVISYSVYKVGSWFSEGQLELVSRNNNNE